MVPLIKPQLIMAAYYLWWIRIYIFLVNDEPRLNECSGPGLNNFFFGTCEPNFLSTQMMMSLEIIMMRTFFSSYDFQELEL